MMWRKNVVIDDVSSDPVPVLSGVPRGSIIWDIFSSWSFYLTYQTTLAPQSKVLRPVRKNIKRSEEQQTFQDDLNKLAMREEAW